MASLATPACLAAAPGRNRTEPFLRAGWKLLAGFLLFADDDPSADGEGDQFDIAAFAIIVRSDPTDVRPERVLAFTRHDECFVTRLLRLRFGGHEILRLLMPQEHRPEIKTESAGRAGMR